MSGTRDDFLIPSACLNSTVSGLVSRTVFNRALIGPHETHGAKFYRELAPRDVSNEFVDAVAARFPDIRPGLPGPPPSRRGRGGPPWSASPPSRASGPSAAP
ncbi:cysteine protease StiP domain-containing protein [Sinomonas atrocyanea]